MNKKRLLSCIIAASSLLGAYAQPHTFDVNTKKVGAAVQPTMYGIFFEDINYAADGGLYGELVKNRSFEFPDALMGWKAFGKFEVKNDGPFERCPHYVVLNYSGHNDTATGLQNEGYFGIGIEKDEEYRFTVWAKTVSGDANVEVSLVDESTMEEHQEFATAELKVSGNEWKKYELILKSSKTVQKANLRLLLKGKNGVALEHVSLFPKYTFKDRENGMRRDLAQALYDLHPGVFRFPGGCIVEGSSLDQRYQWKNTIGPVENRPLNGNRWLSTFNYRLFPDYYQSYGLGFYEYFLLSEDIGAEPLPVLNVGMACQFQNHNDPSAHVAVEDLQPYIQDCLDLIEFANGDVNTTWGKKRAEMGHPAPFNLKFLAVGNEHWFLSHGLRYEGYDRKGPKVFAGEYACHGKGKKWNHFETSLYEAAFMTDLERNADVVDMATYAPLFAHVDGWQWRPDMIWYDNTRMFKSVSYYVQQMYACNKGTNVLPLTMNGKSVAGQEGQDGLFASAVVDKKKGEIIVKVANTSDKAQDVTLNLNGLKGSRSATATTLQSDNMDAENTLDNPNLIRPVETTATCESKKNMTVLNDKLPAKSFRMYKIK